MEKTESEHVNDGEALGSGVTATDGVAVGVLVGVSVGEGVGNGATVGTVIGRH